MKRIKLLSYGLVLIAFFSLSSCTEDAILDEIIDNTELQGPTLETGEDDGDDDGTPSN